MPYIDKKLRKNYDYLINELVSKLKSQKSDEVDGILNYFITKVIRQVYPMKYFDQNRLIGMLNCIAMEHYRTVLGDYEDEKIKLNGVIE